MVGGGVHYLFWGILCFHQVIQHKVLLLLRLSDKSTTDLCNFIIKSIWRGYSGSLKINFQTKLCKSSVLFNAVLWDVAAEEECRYPGHCTFAYCQEEIDVWTLERKGAFSREALFGGPGKINLTVSQLLQEYHGLFMFLCEVLLYFS